MLDLIKIDENIERLFFRYKIDRAHDGGAGWKNSYSKDCVRVLKALAKKTMSLLLGKNISNGQNRILRAYDAQWKKKVFERYAPVPQVTGAPWVWKQKKWLMSNEAGAAFRLVYLNQVIEELKPKTVLEVGCGNGINLLLLAARYPEIRFIGLEPTEGGVHAVRSVIDDGCLPEALQMFAPFAIKDIRGPSRLQVEQGDARSLPFEDGSFDLVITSLALEQMEEIRAQALSEIVRVSSKWVAMLEPFKEVNLRGWRRLYVSTYDYFEGSIADLPAWGLQVKYEIRDMPHKAMLGTALVVAQRSA